MLPWETEVRGLTLGTPDASFSHKECDNQKEACPHVTFKLVYETRLSSWCDNGGQLQTNLTQDEGVGEDYKYDESWA